MSERETPSRRATDAAEPAPVAGAAADRGLEAAKAEFSDAATALFQAVARPAGSVGEGSPQGKPVSVAGFVTLLVVAVDLALIYRFAASLIPADFLDYFERVIPVAFGTLLAAFVTCVSKKLRDLAGSTRFRVAAGIVLAVTVLPGFLTLRVPVQVSAPARLELDGKPFRARPTAPLFIETDRFAPQDLTVVERYSTEDGSPVNVTELYRLGTLDLLWGTARYWLSKLRMDPGARRVTASYPLLVHNPEGSQGVLLVTGEFDRLYLRKMLRELRQSRRTGRNTATLSYPLKGVFVDSISVPPDTFDVVLYNEELACGRRVPEVVVGRKENKLDFAGLPCDSTLVPP